MTIPHFRFTCPNPKCGELVPSRQVRDTNCCPACGTFLLPTVRDLRSVKA